MQRESIVMGLAGVFLGLLVGWILGSQSAGARPAAAPPAAQASAPAAGGGAQQPAPPLDEKRAAELRADALKNTSSPAPRVQLGNLYFDAEQYAEAARWYEEAIKLDPKDPNVSTDLGIAYYYQNQPDRALQQFEQSLKIDPAHSKTLLNIGVVRAWGKQDLEGAARAWERVIEVAPNSEEAKRAKQGLDGIRSAHPDAGKGRGSS
jgi:tetratricopeptide (TPR) repeat protein